MNSTLRDPSLKWGRLGGNWASSRKVEAASRDAVRTRGGCASAVPQRRHLES